MPKRKRLIKPLFIQELNLQDNDPKNFYAISNLTSLTIDSDRQDTSQINYSNSYFAIENEEEEKSNGLAIDIIDKKEKMKSKRLTKRRKNVIQKKDSQYFINRKKEEMTKNKKPKNNVHDKNYNKKDELVRKNKVSNKNTMAELDDCYKKLETLFSNHSFTEIAHILLKIMNDINEDDNSQLFSEIKEATSKIKNKESIAMMCVSILSSKIPLNMTKNKTNEKENNGIEKTEDPSDIIVIDNSPKYENPRDCVKTKENCKKKVKKSTYINEYIKLKKSDYNYPYGYHYHKCDEQIYSFSPKTNKKANPLNLKSTRRCKKSERSFANQKKSNETEFNGKHNYMIGISRK